MRLCTGLVTARDVDSVPDSKHATTKISEVMMPRDRLITGNENFTLEHAYTILENQKKGMRRRRTKFGK